MIQYLSGDATKPQTNSKVILPHICNDVGGWGAGFVMALSGRWDKPEASYRNNIAKMSLGDVDFVKVEDNLEVANMIGQRGMISNDNVKPIRYASVLKALIVVYERAVETGSEIHMPKIGSGLAGGDWKKIENIINIVAKNYNIPTYVYEF